MTREMWSNAGRGVSLASQADALRMDLRGGNFGVMGPVGVVERAADVGTADILSFVARRVLLRKCVRDAVFGRMADEEGSDLAVETRGGRGSAVRRASIATIHSSSRKFSAMRGFLTLCQSPPKKERGAV